MLSDDDISALLELGGEQRAVEFKGAGDISESAFVAKVARAALALANYRGGGSIILGIIDAEPTSPKNGLTPKQVKEWTNLDDTMAKINTYSNPALELQIAARKHPAGGDLVVIKVREFERFPVICRRDFAGVLAEGQLYTRSAAKVESSSRFTHGELNEVLNLAIEKGLQDFLRTATGAGIAFSPDGATAIPKSFASQRDNAYSAQPENTADTPQFRITVRPQNFDERRFGVEDLREHIFDSHVIHYGWTFPTISLSGQGQDWISGTFDDHREAEYWRYFRSALFASVVRVMPANKDEALFLSDAQTVAGYLPVYQVIILLTMVLEFAARLQEQLGGRESLLVGIQIYGIRDFALAVANPSDGRGFYELYKYADDALVLDEIVLSPGTSIDDTREIALLAASKVFHHFGWLKARPELIKRTQDKVFLGL